jgi:polyhydroxyalkanoate synthase subunit PhaC
MAGKDDEKDRSRPGAPVPGPDAMFGLWAAWVEQFSAATPGVAGAGNPWAAVGIPASGMAEAGAEVIEATLSKDPTLRAVAEMWQANPLSKVVPIDWAGVAWALRTVWLRSMARPEAAQSMIDLNLKLWRSTIDVWQEAGQRWFGTAEASGSEAGARPDKRFDAPEWQTNPGFRLLKEVYTIASDWLLRQGEADDMDEAERRRITFHLRQFVDAMSPALLLMSNPVALRRAIETGGASVAAGARNLLADLSAGRLSMVDADAFAPGRNLALTSGKVVYRNRLIELIQYAPTTKSVHATPLLIVPPWINKYYVLDMQPKNSMVRHLVEQGFTVFVISWRNPDASMDGIAIEDYMDLGPLAASDVAREITGSSNVNVMGYCIGGTLMSLTLAVLAAKDDDRFRSASFMTSPGSATLPSSWTRRGSSSSSGRCWSAAISTATRCPTCSTCCARTT